MPELTREQKAAKAGATEAKRIARERETLEMAMGNVMRRRIGVKAENKAVELATRDCAIAAAAVGYTYDEIANALGISRQRVGQLLGQRAATKKARQKQEAKALDRAAKVATETPDTGTDDGLVPAVADL